MAEDDLNANPLLDANGNLRKDIFVYQPYSSNLHGSSFLTDMDRLGGEGWEMIDNCEERSRIELEPAKKAQEIIDYDGVIKAFKSYADWLTGAYNHPVDLFWLIETSVQSEEPGSLLDGALAGLWKEVALEFRYVALPDETIMTDYCSKIEKLYSSNDPSQTHQLAIAAKDVRLQLSN